MAGKFSFLTVILSFSDIIRYFIGFLYGISMFSLLFPNALIYFLNIIGVGLYSFIMTNPLVYTS